MYDSRRKRSCMNWSKQSSCNGGMSLQHHQWCHLLQGRTSYKKMMILGIPVRTKQSNGDLLGKPLNKDSKPHSLTVELCSRGNLDWSWWRSTWGCACCAWQFPALSLSHVPCRLLGLKNTCVEIMVNLNELKVKLALNVLWPAQPDSSNLLRHLIAGALSHKGTAVQMLQVRVIAASISRHKRQRRGVKKAFGLKRRCGWKEDGRGFRSLVGKHWHGVYIILNMGKRTPHQQQQQDAICTLSISWQLLGGKGVEGVGTPH